MTHEAIDSREVSRRRFLAGAVGTATIGGLLPLRNCPAQDANKPQPKRVAAINTVYRIRSHAYHIVGRFLEGYTIGGFHHQPNFKIVRMYNDQYPRGDLSKGLAKRHGFRLCKTVAETLGGSDSLDVDAVLLIGEHGSYPQNKFQQTLYPRHRLFMEIMDVFRKSGRSIPVFSDKHLSYDHKKAAHMVALSKKLKFGFMAGSSLPVTWRRPELEPPLNTQLTEGLACYGGSLESYLFHGLETLQCLMERRQGGETGVRSVRLLEGDAVWKAEKAGLWSRELLESALARSPSRNVGDVRRNVVNPYALLIEYRDGTRGTVLNLPEHISDFNFAGRIKGRRKPVSTNFILPAPPGARFFDPLTYNIEKLFETGRSPYPVERTLLTTTVLDFAMHSLAEKGKMLTSPRLGITYKPPKSSGFFRGRYTDAG